MKTTVRIITVIIAMGAALSSATAQEAFKLAVLPDTQSYSWYAYRGYDEIFYRQGEYVSADNRFAFVTHVGDIVETGNSASEWAIAEQAYSYLDISGTPYGVVGGNHDYDDATSPGDSTSFTNHFGPERFTGKSWEYAARDSSGLTSYHIFNGGGRQFMSLSLRMNASDADLAWAQSAIDQHPYVAVLVTTHEHIAIHTNGRPTQGYLEGYHEYTDDNSNSPEEVWQEFIRINPQIFMVLSGHWDGEYHLSPLNDAGRPVHEILANYQSWENGGGGYLRELHFIPDENKIEVHTYSPWLDVWETDADSRFDLPFNYAEYVPEPVLLGDANNDGVVSADDYGSVQLNFGDTGDINIPGDANLDGVVSADDYGSVQLNFGATAGGIGGVPVPEPAMLSLLAFGSLAILRRRKG